VIKARFFYYDRSEKLICFYYVISAIFYHIRPNPITGIKAMYAAEDLKISLDARGDFSD
jgi:hypothetical protein